MLSAALLIAALPAGLLLVYAGFTAARVMALVGPPTVTLPGCDNAVLCAAPAAQSGGLKQP